MSGDIRVYPVTYGSLPGQTPVRRDKPLLNGQTPSIDTGLPARKPDITQPMTMPAQASPGNDMIVTYLNTPVHKHRTSRQVTVHAKPIAPQSRRESQCYANERNWSFQCGPQHPSGPSPQCVPVGRYASRDRLSADSSASPTLSKSSSGQTTTERVGRRGLSSLTGRGTRCASTVGPMARRGGEDHLWHM
jgi:hypothetical protein